MTLMSTGHEGCAEPTTTTCKMPPREMRWITCHFICSPNIPRLFGSNNLIPCLIPVHKILESLTHYMRSGVTSPRVAGSWAQELDAVGACRRMMGGNRIRGGRSPELYACYTPAT